MLGSLIPLCLDTIELVGEKKKFSFHIGFVTNEIFCPSLKLFMFSH
jgi:hypothetical protein